ncbi:hypothetical protein XM38_050610 [Halomicronema hongdechloris C2206]|uniref:Plastid lipid-associated protein/fibrillin conserved domain-containing protein n=1 Tax=Halomicronema hongdechloris C2206 TaxID=1641165 RepID=A0A1Z3HVB9_9CYAN|nr:PAP/fibrillin family protein [Halomicronema hongdechloris]ASC74087.1 hypothetical protein XM38_050610 [Halomicronema hongdechloris C2206]
MLGKPELKAALAPLNRGLLASPSDQKAVLAAIARLEDRNPYPQPLDTPELLDGNWRLLYTTSQDLLNIDRVPLFSLGPIYQCIRLQEQRLYNIAEVNGPPLLDGLVTVAARLTPTSTKRVQVGFERGVFGLRSLLGYQTPDAWIRTLGTTDKLSLLKGVDFRIERPPEQQGWLDITYIDEDLRIGRGNEGNVFVLSR